MTITTILLWLLAISALIAFGAICYLVGVGTGSAKTQEAIATVVTQMSTPRTVLMNIGTLRFHQDQLLQTPSPYVNPLAVSLWDKILMQSFNCAFNGVNEENQRVILMYKNLAAKDFEEIADLAKKEQAAGEAQLVTLPTTGTLVPGPSTKQ